MEIYRGQQKKKISFKPALNGEITPKLILIAIIVDYDYNISDLIIIPQQCHKASVDGRVLHSGNRGFAL